MPADRRGRHPEGAGRERTPIVQRKAQAAVNILLPPDKINLSWLILARRIYFRPDVSLKIRLFSAKRGVLRLGVDADEAP
jgi:hypothetical protein